MLKPIQRITIWQSQNVDPSASANNGTAIPTENPIALQFYSYNELYSNSSWENLVQTCKLVIPRRLRGIGAVSYSYDDYYYMRTSPRLFQEQICGTSSFINQLKVKQWIDLTDPNVSLLYNPNTNNGSRYAQSDANPSAPFVYLEGQRINGLVQHGDLIEIQIGYLILDKDNNTIFDTIYNGNVGLAGSTSQKLPIDLQYYAGNKVTTSNLTFENGILGETETTSYYNIDNRWIPLNRANIFKGYISKININLDGNIQFDCEDYMYLFNRAKVPNKVYDPSDKSAPNYEETTNLSGWTLNNIIYNMLENVINVNELPLPVIQAVDADTGIPKPKYIQVLINPYIDMQVGKLTLKNATVGNVFQKLKDDYNIPIYFYPNTDIIITTPFVYNSEITKPGGAINGTQIGYTNDPASIGQEEFTFIMGEWSLNAETLLKQQGFLKASTPAGFYRNKQNIIKNNLEFRHTDDQPVGAVIKSIFRTDAQPYQGPVTTKDGRTRKELVEHSIHIGDYGGLDFTFFYLATRSDVDTNIYNSSDPIFINGKLNLNNLTKAMKDFGWMQLSHVNYTGFFGSITIQGYGYVRFCDIINIVDFSFPERSSRYYVKKVITKGDVNSGVEQEIFLDYKLPNKNINL